LLKGECGRRGEARSVIFWSTFFSASAHSGRKGPVKKSCPKLSALSLDRHTKTGGRGSARAQRTIPKGARDEAESPRFINHLPKSPRNSLTIQNLTVNLFHNTLKINRKQSFICLLPRIKIIYIFAAI
jgi:hypothetical protein